MDEENRLSAEDENRLSALRDHFLEIYKAKQKIAESMSVLSEKFDKVREDYAHQHDFLKWDRETYAKLYYPLWILFMGGFVFSLSTEKYHGPVSPVMIALIYSFRIVAVFGTALNFYVQHVALIVLRYEWETEVQLRWWQIRGVQRGGNAAETDLATLTGMEAAILDLEAQMGDHARG